MYPFDYAVSLRIRHPSIDPQEVSGSLGLTPDRSWMAGEPKTGPTGRPLQGINRQTYWTHNFNHPDGLMLSRFIERIVKNLKQNERFLHTLVDSGGEVELFIGWFSPKNSGDVFDWELMEQLGELRISLAFDVYGEQIP